ncbi:MAG: iron complex outermembrane receptor protein [Halioglobus sp.]|jgi:outer membrane receptor protein involved in Fe transport
MSGIEVSESRHQRFAKSILARSIATALGVTGAGIVTGQEKNFALEEVIVTARQFNESTQDVPMHIQTLTGGDIKKQGLTSLEDLSRFVPALSISSTSPGQNTITFRGVSDGGGFLVDPTAAIYLDEQPLTITSQAPDIYMADIARVEALAGPQSTLFGASSQSGTIRYITNKPDTTKFEANIGVGVETISEGDTGYDIDATVNIPIIENKLAIRLTGFSKRQAGFVDNVLGTTVIDGPNAFGSGLGGQKTNASVVDDDINGYDWVGGRAQARWHMNDNITATLAMNYQKIDANGFNDHDPTVGDLEVIKFIEEPREDELKQISLVIEADLGFAQLVSATSYFDRQIEYETDTQAYSAYFHYSFGIYLGYATYDFGLDPIGAQTNSQDNDAFTQELRLSSSSDKMQWTLGAFYQEAEENWDFISYLEDYRNSPAFAAWSYYYPGIAPTDAWWLSSQGTERTDMAVFGEIDYSITDKLDLILGGRWFDIDIDRTYQVYRPLSRLEQDLVAGGADDGFVPKVGLQYNFTDEVMGYVLYSEGFRVGGVNRGRGVPTLPVEYESDTLENLELGIKSRWLDGRIQFNATLYTMDWKDVQLEVADPSFAIGEPFQVVVANLGDASVEGIDMDFTAAVSEGLRVGFNLTYIDKAEVEAPATIADDRFEGGQASLGLEPTSELPLFADLAWSAYAEYSWATDWFGDDEAYVRLQHSYTGESLNQLTDAASSPRVVQEDYSQTDIVLGYESGNWTARFAVMNLDDERGTTYDDSTDFDTFFGRSSVNIIRPRRANFSLRYNF